MSLGIIAALTIYPVKSLQGINLNKSIVTEQGLKWDRHWMVVNDDGLFVTQRSLSKMATIKTEITDTHLILTHPDNPNELRISLDIQPKTQQQAKVWKSECEVLNEGKEASDWLVSVLGLYREQKLHLVRMHPKFQRQVSSKHTNGNPNTTIFADGYPFLVTNNTSLLALNKELELQDIPSVPMNRFRGNIIVDQVPAFIEHNSTSLKVKGQNNSLVWHIDLANPCERCPVPGIDQITANIPTPRQPLKTLFNMTHVDKKGAFFGQNAVLAPTSKSQNNLVVAVGDEVEFI